MEDEKLEGKTTEKVDVLMSEFVLERVVEVRHALETINKRIDVFTSRLVGNDSPLSKTSEMDIEDAACF